jgi:hypothetical protein
MIGPRCDWIAGFHLSVCGGPRKPYTMFRCIELLMGTKSLTVSTEYLAPPVAKSDSPTNSVGMIDSPSMLSTSITSVFSVVPTVLPSTFSSLLLEEAPEWWLLLTHCIHHFQFLLLSSQLGFKTSIMQAQAKMALLGRIQEHQKHYPGWLPRVGEWAHVSAFLNWY